MTLNEIGNLGEPIGAAAVVVSLIYLAIQLKQNTLSVRSATCQAILSSAAACNVTLTQNRELARIMRIGSEGAEELDADERVQFSFLAAQFIDIFENLYLQHANGSLDASFWLPRSGSYLGLLQLPGFARFWDERKADYTAAFREWVDMRLSIMQSTASSRERIFLETEGLDAPHLR